MSRNIYYLLDKYFELKLNLQMNDGGVITSITKNTHTGIFHKKTEYDYTVMGHGQVFENSENGTLYLSSIKELREFLSKNCCPATPG